MPTTPYSEDLDEARYKITVPANETHEGVLYQFVRWADGPTDLVRTIDLSNDIDLETIYEEVGYVGQVTGTKRGWNFAPLVVPVGDLRDGHFTASPANPFPGDMLTITALPNDANDDTPVQGVEVKWNDVVKGPTDVNGQVSFTV